ncbi:hypothetical protein RND71_015200 [Anisodus tanguticus]|uniref:Uncharacterized protein n=1 Tax=Anisodus tanguticus TaxID=243964 RepID=A0AAE1S6P9_9SOLA|nr:hypothetical protein RND71_015200 [Anisodus tanguticus]
MANRQPQTENHWKRQPKPTPKHKKPIQFARNPYSGDRNKNTTSLAVGNTVQATENTILQKNTFFEISDAGNPTGILGGAGNPTGTLGGAGDPIGTLPAPSPVQERRFFGHPTFQSFRPIPAILAPPTSRRFSFQKLPMAENRRLAALHLPWLCRFQSNLLCTYMASLLSGLRRRRWR